MVTKSNIGSHAGHIYNHLTFNEAFELVQNNPDRQYETTGNNTSFQANATLGQRGEHSGSRVLIFSSNDTERARAYECCWGHKTNCNSTHIDCYSQAVNA